MKIKQYHIMKNMARCTKCNCLLTSKESNKLLKCKCGSIAIKGGLSILYREGNLKYMNDLSILKEKIITLREELEDGYIGSPFVVEK
jgi:hypothetical protein